MAWNRVKHMRRSHSRMQECDLASFLDTIRLSFYPVGTTVKQLKSAWTHIPSLDFAEACLKRLILVCSLLVKCSETCHAAYRAFALNLVRTGFLPLGVSSMAIAARLQRVDKELLAAVSVAAKGFFPFADKLKPGTSSKYQKALNRLLISNTLSPSAREDLPTVSGETQDLGETIQRQPMEEPRKPALNPTSIILLDDDVEDEPAEKPKPAVLLAATVPADEPMDIEPETTVIEITYKVDNNTKKTKSDSKDKAKKRKKVKAPKSEVPMDEIDDIFGF
ncbi:hypothetical protein FRB90_005512 [Tulasnella sp. 427]|nr:hypothetical protein FRB90_005512 [Tulasnella sp. 427]